MRITYLGHASVLIGLDGFEVLTDPLLRPRIAHLRRVAPAVAAGRLAGVDLILVSHAHHDHLDTRSLRMVGGESAGALPGAGAAGGRGGGPAAGGDGGRRPREHRRGRGRGGPRRPRRPPLAATVAAATRSASSSAGRPDRSTSPATPAGSRRWRGGRPVDVALLPVAGWGPTLGPGHLDPRRGRPARSR